MKLKKKYRRISRTFRAAHNYNVRVSAVPAFKRVTLNIHTRRGQPLTRFFKDRLYFSIPPAEARRLLATLKEMLT